MVGRSVSVNLAFHDKVQKFSSGTGSPGWSLKKGRKTVVVVVVRFAFCVFLPFSSSVVCFCCVRFSFLSTMQRLAGKSISEMTYFCASGT